MPENAVAARRTPEPAQGPAHDPTPRYTRRLSDRVLQAFTHAYAMGAKDVAHDLRAILARMEAETPAGRRNGNSLDQAALWTAFVDARDAYQAASRAATASAAGETEAAFDAMQDAYRRWSAA